MQRILIKFMCVSFCLIQMPLRASVDILNSEDTTPQAVRAVLPAKISTIHTKENAWVNKHDLLLVLEMMKIEIKVLAPFSGFVQKILVMPSSMVAQDEAVILLSKQLPVSEQKSSHQQGTEENVLPVNSLLENDEDRASALKNEDLINEAGLGDAFLEDVTTLRPSIPMLYIQPFSESRISKMSPHVQSKFVVHVQPIVSFPTSYGYAFTQMQDKITKLSEVNALGHSPRVVGRPIRRVDVLRDLSHIPSLRVTKIDEESRPFTPPFMGYLLKVKSNLEHAFNKISQSFDEKFFQQVMWVWVLLFALLLAQEETLLARTLYRLNLRVRGRKIYARIVMVGEREEILSQGNDNSMRPYRKVS